MGKGKEGMMSLREEIAYELYDLFYEDIDYVQHPFDDQTRQFRKPWEEKADKLLSLPAIVEMQRDAEKWRKVVEIAKCEDSDDCPNECPVYDTCTNAICVEAYYIVKHIIDGEENREYDIESEGEG